MSVHIPAWKRLGLKLKYAKEALDTDISSSVERYTATRTPTEKVNLQHDVRDRPNKRRRVDDTQLRHRSNNSVTAPLASTNGSSSARHQFVHTSDAANGDDFSSETTRIKRKKSVSFTTDTKVNFGDTHVVKDFSTGAPSSTLQKSAAVSSHDASPSAEDSGKAKAVAQSTDPILSADNATRITTIKTSATTRKHAKAQQPKQVGTSDTNKNLAYLNTHYQDRKSWKFNKNRDIWILQHALNTDLIPATHSRALAGYVYGLPEKAASRARLIEQCQGSWKELSDLKTGDNGEELRQRLMRLLETPGNEQDHLAAQEWLNAISRPQLLAWSLRISTEEPGSPKIRPLVKKSKVRSSRIEISSSESETDSDSDDSRTDIESTSTSGSSGEETSPENSSTDDSSDSSDE